VSQECDTAIVALVVPVCHIQYCIIVRKENGGEPQTQELPTTKKVDSFNFEIWSTMNFFFAQGLPTYSSIAYLLEWYRAI
jgi:hypothetical protein